MSGTKGQLDTCPDFDYAWCCKRFAEEKYMAQIIWGHQYELTNQSNKSEAGYKLFVTPLGQMGVPIKTTWSVYKLFYAYKAIYLHLFIL